MHKQNSSRQHSTRIIYCFWFVTGRCSETVYKHFLQLFLVTFDFCDEVGTPHPRLWNLLAGKVSNMKAWQYYRLFYTAWALLPCSRRVTIPDVRGSPDNIHKLDPDSIRTLVRCMWVVTGNLAGGLPRSPCGWPDSSCRQLDQHSQFSSLLWATSEPYKYSNFIIASRPWMQLHCFIWLCNMISYTEREKPNQPTRCRDLVASWAREELCFDFRMRQEIFLTANQPALS